MMPRNRRLAAVAQGLVLTTSFALATSLPISSWATQDTDQKPVPAVEDPDHGSDPRTGQGSSSASKRASDQASPSTHASPPASQQGDTGDAGAPPVQVNVELEPQQLAPGDSAELRISVLVPTWMPEPVAFPSLDQPGLRVSLGDRSTTPTSQRVGGETWSGVSRRYRLTPLSAGRFELGGNTLTVTYASAEDNTPTEQRFTLPPLTLSAQLPEAAKGLDPYLAATDIALVQTLKIVRAGDVDADADTAPVTDTDTRSDSGSPTESAETPIELKAGDSVTRTVTATLSGGSALLLPGLPRDEAHAALGIYPATPRLEETSSGGVRTDSVTYVAEAGGKDTLPAVQLRWYDPESGELESAELAPIDVNVAAPALARSSDTWAHLALIAIPLLLVLALLVWLWRRFSVGTRMGDQWRARARQRQQRREANGQADLVRLERSLAKRDLIAVRRYWQAVAPHLHEDSAARRRFAAELDDLCRHQLGPCHQHDTDHDPAPAVTPADAGEAQWRRLHQALPGSRELRSSSRTHNRSSHDRLPALNPIAQVTRHNA